MHTGLLAGNYGSYYKWIYIGVYLYNCGILLRELILEGKTNAKISTQDVSLEILFICGDETEWRRRKKNLIIQWRKRFRIYRRSSWNECLFYIELNYLKKNKHSFCDFIYEIIHPCIIPFVLNKQKVKSNIRFKKEELHFYFTISIR